MSEDKNPIFPRSSERSEVENAEIRQKTKQNLEIIEQIFEQKITCTKCQTENFAKAKFCRVCGENLSQASLYYENGRYELVVSRRLPLPFNDLNEGQSIPILQVLDHTYQKLLFLPHPLINNYNTPFSATETVRLNGDCFILLSNRIKPFDDDDIEYPLIIVKLDMDEVVLEILSHQTFLDVVAVMQKKIDEKVVENFMERDLAEAIFFVSSQLNRNKNGEDDDIHTTPLELASEPPTNPEQQYEITEQYEPTAMMLEDNLDNDLHTTVYGPPPMELDIDPPTLPNIKIDKDPIPPMPMIAPAYGPPPMSFVRLKKNKLLWFAVGILIVLTFLTLFFIFR